VGDDRPFLTAQWRDLLLLNYEVPESLLDPLVPAGTRLDRVAGRLLASVVGFRFLDTRVRGWSVPFHRHFEEVNLRFYVRRALPSGEVRRAVVFVRELVPKRAVAWVARVVYNEPYLAVPMGHRLTRSAPDGPPSRVEYSWAHGHRRGRLAGSLAMAPTLLQRPSEAEFITEHYWGYTRQRDGGTMEYQVTHPPWTVATVTDALLTGKTDIVYGPAWQAILNGPPHSAFYANGSEVAVFAGRRLKSSPVAA
jgi:uncharacterized protein YqjF (DUF2071 family)